jgi:xylulokinase
MTARPGVCIGLDLGTSGLKAVAVDGFGQVVAAGRASYPTSMQGTGAAEQSPRHWLAALWQASRQLAAQVSPGRWRAIGLSAMMPTLVTTGSDGQPNGPAVTWQDSRAEERGRRLRDACGPDRLYLATGQWVDGRYLVPMFARLADDEPGRAAATDRILSAKDYLFQALTGEPVTDPSTASGYGCYGLSTGAWDERVLRTAASQLGTPLPALPPVLPSGTARPLLAAAADRLGCGQIPVCLGAADSVAGALGLGVRAPGQIGYIAGTSTVIVGVAGRPLFDPAHRFIVVPLAEPGAWGLEMDLLATGSALRWLAELLGDGLDEAAVAQLGAGVDPADAPVLLPYLSPGEQGALWDPALHGTAAWLTLQHGRQHLARGLLSGIVLESRRCLAVLAEAATFGTELRVAGGGAAAAMLRGDLADATGSRVVRPAGVADCSAIGAALLAARAAGLGWQGAGRPAEISDPDERRARTWDMLWARHERTRLAAAALYHEPTQRRLAGRGVSVTQREQLGDRGPVARGASGQHASALGEQRDRQLTAPESARGVQVGGPSDQHRLVLAALGSHLVAHGGEPLGHARIGVGRQEHRVHELRVRLVGVRVGADRIGELVPGQHHHGR